jgi:lycopene beta-cyclase
LPMKILNATYTYNPTYNRVWTGFFTIMFWTAIERKQHHFFERKVTDINELKNHVYVATDKTNSCDQVFNSIYNKVAETQTQFPVLQQHFIGWFIKSDEAVLIPHELLSWIFSCAKTLVLCTCCLHLPPKLY